MKIKVLRSILVEGNHVECGETIEAADAIATQLIHDGEAVRAEEPVKKLK